MAKEHLTCPNCGHSGPQETFEASAMRKRESDLIRNAFGIIRKQDPGISSHDGLAMASAVHVAERRKKLGW